MPPGPQGFAVGGVVTPGALIGPKPNNPDDGYGSLQDGEFVVRSPRPRNTRRSFNRSTPAPIAPAPITQETTI
jgi:hypothetical protein